MESGLLEICVDSLKSVDSATFGGADRLELCQALELGGLTPSTGLLKIAKTIAAGTQIYVMIRTRSGNFEYTLEEIEAMTHDTEMFARCGADGIVFGALDSKGKVDRPACDAILKAAGNLPVTFHRAFDYTLDYERALEDIIKLGFKRILTSGQATTAFQGKSKIKELVNKSIGRVVIMPGSGIVPIGLERFLIETGVTEIHSSGQRKRVVGTGDDGIVKGCTSYLLTDFEIVKSMKEILNRTIRKTVL